MPGVHLFVQPGVACLFEISKIGGVINVTQRVAVSKSNVESASENMLHLEYSSSEWPRGRCGVDGMATT